MNDSLSVVDRSSVDPKFIASELLARLGVGRKQDDILSFDDNLVKRIMHDLYDSQIPLLKGEDKKSYSFSEWQFEGNNFKNAGLLRTVYDDLAIKRWTNGDDVAFFEYIGIYNGQKIRIIFQNSIGYSGTESKKLSFDDWMKQGEYAKVRICLD